MNSSKNDKEEIDELNNQSQIISRKSNNPGINIIRMNNLILEDRTQKPQKFIINSPNKNNSNDTFNVKLNPKKSNNLWNEQLKNLLPTIDQINQQLEEKQIEKNNLNLLLTETFAKSHNIITKLHQIDILETEVKQTIFKQIKLIFIIIF